jgi:hypothetical protein
MMRLKHFGLQIEVHAIAPTNFHAKINNLNLRFDSRLSAIDVFAELSAATVDGCQLASLTKDGILIELFWTFQTAKSWDLKRSSPAREMFNLFFNGALIHPSDCATYFDQIVSIVTKRLDDVHPKKRHANFEDIFIQATACVTCTWDDTYKHRGTTVLERCLFWLLDHHYLLQGANGCYIETCKWAVIVETCSQLCDDILARSSVVKTVPSHESLENPTWKYSKNGFPVASRTSMNRLMLSGSSSVDSFAVHFAESQALKGSKCDLSASVPLKKVVCEHSAHDTFAKLQDCHSVNGISLRDLEEFEAQLMEVKNVNASYSFEKSDTVPILKAAVLGSRSASSLTKHPKNLNISNPRLSLSCSSKMNGRESSPVLALSEVAPACLHDSSPSVLDQNAIRLSKVHML